MALRIELETARAALDQSVGALQTAIDGLTDYELLAATRCYGWARLDLVTHLIGGWHELLAGLVCTVPDAPTVDAASYWTAFAAEFGAYDPVEAVLAQRRRADAYPRPGSARAHLDELATAVLHGTRLMPDRPCRWQGHVFRAGDFLAVWAVEHAVHHLDLDLATAAGEPPAAALTLARSTVEALAGQALPVAWSDREAVLIGTGRLPVPDGEADLATRLPALG